MTSNDNNINLGNKDENPFKVPKNYFENLEDSVMDTINRKEGDFKVPILKVMKPYLYLAAGFLLIFVVGKTFLTNSDVSPNTLTSNELTIDEEMDLIYSEVDDFTITNYLLEDDLEESSNK